MTKLELQMTNNELEARVIELEVVQQSLELDLKNAERETEELEAANQALQLELDYAHTGHDRECRRCYRHFRGSLDAQYCSHDCQYFRRQEPFETFYRQLHPESEWLTKTAATP